MAIVLTLPKCPCSTEHLKWSESSLRYSQALLRWTTNLNIPSNTSLKKQWPDCGDFPRTPHERNPNALEAPRRSIPSIRGCQWECVYTESIPNPLMTNAHTAWIHLHIPNRTNKTRMLSIQVELVMLAQLGCCLANSTDTQASDCTCACVCVWRCSKRTIEYTNKVSASYWNARMWLCVRAWPMAVCACMCALVRFNYGRYAVSYQGLSPNRERETTELSANRRGEQVIHKTSI